MVKCETCKREFKTAQGLSSHRQRIHEGIKVDTDTVRGVSRKALDVVLSDLCPDCQDHVKDKFFSESDVVNVTADGKKSSEWAWLLLPILAYFVLKPKPIEVTPELSGHDAYK